MWLNIIILMIINAINCKTSFKNKPVNITYVYIKNRPYEEIVNNTWQYKWGKEQDKPLQGIISRSIHFISRKHCPHFRFVPQQISSIYDMVKSLYNNTYLNDLGLNGKYFIFSPLSMGVKLYHQMQYNPRKFTLQPNFVESKGIVVLQRMKDVDVSHRLLRALRRSDVLLFFIGCLLPIISLFKWIMDRKVKNHEHKNPIKVYIYICIYKYIHLF